MVSRTFVTGSVFIGLLLTLGCQNNAPPPAGKMLAGKVTYQGKALQYGTVTFLAESGKRHKAVIKTDGTYRLTRPEAGNYKVSVDTTVPPAALGGGPAGPPPKPIKMPTGMEDPDKSGLTTQIAEDSVQYDIVVPEKTQEIENKPDNKKDEKKKE